MCIFSPFILKIALCSRVNSGAASKWLTHKSLWQVQIAVGRDLGGPNSPLWGLWS